MCANTNYKYGIFNGELLKVSKVFNGPEDRIEKMLKISPTFMEKSIQAYLFNLMEKCIFGYVFNV